jgi:hypothetical protein
MAPLKTYFLVPDFHFLPDGPIALGNIIEDPASPTRVLSRLDPPVSPEKVNISREKDAAYGESHSGSLTAGIWARFLQIASVNVEGTGGSDTKVDYTMSEIETHMLKHDPTDKEATERAKDPDVEFAMENGVFGDRPVYMVTAVMIARDFSFKRKAGSRLEGHVSADGAVSTEASTGAHVGGGSHMKEYGSAKATNDIVFAFRLHIIAKKGLLKKRIESRVFQSKAAFLGRDDGTLSDEEAMTAFPVGEEDLTDLSLEGVSISAENITDNKESCVCISLKES